MTDFCNRRFETTAALRGRTSENRYPAFSFVKPGAGSGETVVAREVTAIYKENILTETRFLIPDFGNGLIKRKRLIDKMGQKETYKIILLTAPAGYGKTALIKLQTELDTILMECRQSVNCQERY